MALFFTADTHFGHKNIIDSCMRSFSCVEDMDEGLIKKWNQTVRPHDTVYHLGDFKVNNHNKIKNYTQRLNGKIHLIRGNHDFSAGNLALAGFVDIHDLLVIKPNTALEIVLCHYSMRVWQKKHYGAIHLFGHSHGQLPQLGRSFDVGVDCWNYAPVSLEQVIERADHPLNC